MGLSRCPEPERCASNAAGAGPPRPHSEIATLSLRAHLKDTGRRFFEQFKPLKPQVFNLRPKTAFINSTGLDMSDMTSPIEPESPRRSVPGFPTTSTSKYDTRPYSECLLSGTPGPKSLIGSLTGSTLADIPTRSGRRSRTIDRALGGPTPTVDGILPLDASHSVEKTRGPRHWIERAKEYTAVLKDGPIRERVALLDSGPVTPPEGDLLGVGSCFSEQQSAMKSILSELMLKSGEIGATDLSLNTPNIIHHNTKGATTGNHAFWGYNNTSHNRNSNNIIPQDESAALLTNHDSKPSLPIRSLYIATMQAESILDRPNSRVFTATSTWDLTFRSFQTHSIPMTQRCRSSSSSLATVNNIPHHDLDLQGNPTLSLPGGQASNPHIVDNMVSSLEHTVCSQATTAGWIAQQRRTMKVSTLLISSDDKEDKEEGRDVPSNAKSSLETQNDMDTVTKSGLSVIYEGCPDAVLSDTDVIISKHRCAVDRSVREHLCTQPSPSVRHTRSMSEMETVEGQSSIYSGESRRRNDTPATSDTDQPTPDMSEMPDISEGNETMSDFTDETDETDNSLVEAFAATTIDPSLLPNIIFLKDQVSARVFEKVSEWVRSCQSGQSTERTNSNSNTPSEANSGFDSFDSISGRDSAGRKRGFDGNNPSDSGRGNGDDRDKRRKTGLPSTKEDTDQIEKRFACPFSKRYPDRKFSLSCTKNSWPTVHRLKEHIYRNHTIPVHCDRCGAVFKTAGELTEHIRQDVPCSKVVDPTKDMIGIDEAVEKRLRNRKGMQNLPERERWNHVYKILFPDVEEIPSPYHILETVEAPSNRPEMMAKCVDLIRRKVPDQVISQTTKNILRMPEVLSGIRGQERVLSEIIHKAVWDAFDEILSTLLPQPSLERAPDGVLSGGVTSVPRELTDDMVMAQEAAGAYNSALQLPIQIRDIAANVGNDNLRFNGPMPPATMQDPVYYPGNDGVCLDLMSQLLESAGYGPWNTNSHTNYDVSESHGA